MSKTLDVQTIISLLNEFWQKQGCAILQPYDANVGAGTLHPATVIDCVSKEELFCAYVQPSRRPKDSRYGLNPNRLQRHTQYQVILKPSPSNIQELYLRSLEHIGLHLTDHDIRFVEDDWENPSVGAWGLGWEVWLNGMEVSQFTYMQQIASVDLDNIAGEITYGLERLALYIQDKDNVYDLVYSEFNGKQLTYRELFKQSEYEFSCLNLDEINIENLFDRFAKLENEISHLVKKQLPLAAYDMFLQASHSFNLLDARGSISVNERGSYLARLRAMAREICVLQKEIYQHKYK